MIASILAILMAAPIITLLVLFSLFVVLEHIELLGINYLIILLIGIGSYFTIPDITFSMNILYYIGGYLGIGILYSLFRFWRICVNKFIECQRVIDVIQNTVGEYFGGRLGMDDEISDEMKRWFNKNDIAYFGCSTLNGIVKYFKPRFSDYKCVLAHYVVMFPVCLVENVLKDGIDFIINNLKGLFLKIPDMVFKNIKI